MRNTNDIPVDRTAARVIRKGIHYNAQPKPGRLTLKSHGGRMSEALTRARVLAMDKGDDNGNTLL